MGRNRRNQPAAIRFGPAIKALVLCLLIGGSGIGYVWQKDQIGRLGDQIKAREMALQRVVLENENRRKQLAKMSSPPFLQLRIRELNLGLVEPDPSQVWRLPEPSPEPRSPARESQLASSGQVPGGAFRQ